MNDDRGMGSALAWTTEGDTRHQGAPQVGMGISEIYTGPSSRWGGTLGRSACGGGMMSDSIQAEDGWGQYPVGGVRAGI